MERGSARFRTKEHFLPFQLSPLAFELRFYTFSFLSLLGFLIAHPSTSRARERNGIGRVSFSDIWFSPCKPPPPLESYIPAKASFTVTVLETRNDQNNFFMRGPLEDAGLSFFGCLDLVLPGWQPPPLLPFSFTLHPSRITMAKFNHHTGLDSPLFYASYLRYNIYTDSI